MSVLINFKICDNAFECGGIAVCPTKALSYDLEKETIVIDNDRCISCGRCEKECPIGAIRVAKSEDEYNKIQEEINNDSRTIQDLFVDRYGATPLLEFFKLEEKELPNKIKDKGITIVEFYNDDSIQCLIKSIPIKKIVENVDKKVMFYKLMASEHVVKEYNISELPALLIFENGKLKGSLDGYYTVDYFDEFISKINNILI